MRNRLAKEWNKLKEKELDNIRLFPTGDSLFKWNAYFKGPSETPYSDGIFELSIDVPKNYPIAPPRIHFVTKIFDGSICLDILKSAWSPAWSLESTVRAIIALLASPAADSPLNCDAGNLIRRGDMIGFHSLARMYTIDNSHTRFPDDK